MTGGDTRRAQEALQQLVGAQSCDGCLNIADGSFPFGTNSKGQPAIDTEGCGHYDHEQYSWLAISFCPVCGRRLESA